jgi:signal transduction histidine kinase
MPFQLILFIFFSVVAIFLVFGLYSVLTDRVYRHPSTLLWAGVITAVFGAFLKGIPILIKGLPNHVGLAAELELAVLVVDPLLGGLAGGLVAAAVIVKLQIMHAKSQISANEDDQYADEEIEQAWLHCQRVDEMKGSMPENELEERRARASDAMSRALDRKRKAEKRLREVSVPGLCEAKPARSKRQRLE